MNDARPKTPRGKRAPKAVPARHTIVLVGDPNRVAPVEAELRKLDAELRLQPWSAILAEPLDEEVVAVVLVAPIVRVPMRVAVGRLREFIEDRDLAIFAVVPDEATDSQVRRIYERGATAVLLWPQETTVLTRCMLEMIAMLRVRGRPSKPDRALARAVRAHFRSLPGIDDGAVRVEVNQGVAFLAGEVPLLWKKQVAIEAAAAVAGIRSVVGHDLRVSRSELSDRNIARRIRRVLRDTSQVDESTLAVRIDRGHTILAGSVASRHELHHVVDLLANVRGVRSVDPLAVVSAKQQKLDRAEAKRLRQAVANHFDQQDVSVSFFGSVAQLAGRVDRARRAHEVERMVAEHDGVERVINKIDVAS